MDKDYRHALNEIRDRVGRSLNLFYDNVGKHHHGVSGHVASGFQPPAEADEQETGLEISLELPGIDREDLEVIAAEGRLTVRGKKEREREGKGLTYLVRERAYGSFERSFVLPKSLAPENATARLRNGMLKIRVPRKAGSKSTAREIPIRQ
jgi:HSP20 family protein